MTYVISALELCDFLFIGITNPDPMNTQTNQNDLNRSKLSSNPFSFYERALMIMNTLLDLKFEPNSFLVVPFPINFPERIEFYTPQTATYFITIYDDWGRYKKKLFEDLGYSVNVLWEKEIKSISASIIRDLIKKNQPWSNLVPNPVSKYIIENNLTKRIRKNKND